MNTSRPYGSELTKDIPTVTKKPEHYLDRIYMKNFMFLAPTTTYEIRIIIENPPPF